MQCAFVAHGRIELLDDGAADATFPMLAFHEHIPGRQMDDQISPTVVGILHIVNFGIVLFGKDLRAKHLESRGVDLRQIYLRVEIEICLKLRHVLAAVRMRGPH